MRFVLIRHGETDWNEAGRYQGWEDRPLTEGGRQTARDICRVLVDRGITEFELWSSDLQRARVPLFLFIALVLVVILYFLGLIMGFLARIGRQLISCSACLTRDSSRVGRVTHPLFGSSGSNPCGMDGILVSNSLEGQKTAQIALPPA